MSHTQASGSASSRWSATGQPLITLAGALLVRTLGEANFFPNEEPV